MRGRSLKLKELMQVEALNKVCDMWEECWREREREERREERGQVARGGCNSLASRCLRCQAEGAHDSSYTTKVCISESTSE